MAFDIAVTEDFLTGNEDRRWTGLRKGYDTNRPVTLAPSAFDEAHFSAKGAIPSGTLLAKITSGDWEDFYGPYDPDATDGREETTDLLFLFNTTRIPRSGSAPLEDAAPVGVPGMFEGLIKTQYLPTFDGTDAGELDADAREALSVRFRFEDDTLDVSAGFPV